MPLGVGVPYNRQKIYSSFTGNEKFPVVSLELPCMKSIQRVPLFPAVSLATSGRNTLPSSCTASWKTPLQVDWGLGMEQLITL